MARPRDGEMGVLGDALLVSAGSGGVLSVLALSLTTWLSQPRGHAVRIRVEGRGGRFVEIDADRIAREQVDALICHALGSGVLEE